MKREEGTVWKDIPGLSGRYQVSIDGRVRNTVTGTTLKGAGAFGSYYALYLGNYKKRTFTIGTLLGMTFIGPAPPGFHYYHKNGIPTDHHARNIGMKPAAELFAMANNLKKREIVQIDRTGEITATFPSIREAARRLPFTRPAIRCRCDGFFIKYGRKYRNRSVFASDGYAYAWDDEEHVEQALERIAEETAGEPVIIDISGYKERDALPEGAPAVWLDDLGGGIAHGRHGNRCLAGY